jgi:DHA1 family bicyclomycin/chloramphenicol resistance-like MFS transporter
MREANKRLEPKRPWALICVLSGLSMLGAFSIDAYLPSFGAIAVAFHVDRAAVQHSLTIYLLTFAVMMMFYGTLSDTFGRRRVILISIVGYLIGSLAGAFASSYSALLVARALQGLSAGAGAVVGSAVVRDLYPGSPGQKMMAYVKLVFSIAPAVAPVIGGWLEVWFGWRAVFVFLALAAVAILLATFRVLPESLPEESRQPLHFGLILRNYLRVARHRSFMLQVLAIGFSFGGFSLYVSTASDFVMNVLHLPETAFAWLFIPIIIGMSSGSLVSARLAGKLSARQVVVLAYAVMGAAALVNLGYVTLWVPTVPWAVCAPMVYMFGISLANPTMTLKAMDQFPQMRGMAASFQGFIQMILFAAVSGLVAPLVFGDARKLALGLMVGWTLSGLCWWLSSRVARAS